MPGSMPDGKEFIRNFFINKDIRRILDVGPGSGNYPDLFNGVGEYSKSPVEFLGIEWIAVEIFEPYVTMFEIPRKYDRIIISDIYDVNWDTLGVFDIVILGDVLEHMDQSRGVEVIEKAVNHAAFVVLSLPIIDYPQGASYGNQHEAHVEQYTPQKIERILSPYHILASYEGDIIGAYIFRKNLEWK